MFDLNLVKKLVFGYKVVYEKVYGVGLLLMFGGYVWDVGLLL